MDIFQKIKLEFLACQRVMRYFEQPRNMLVYKSLEESERQKIDTLIASKDLDTIRVLLNDTLDLSQRNIGYLRTIARMLCIHKYASLSRMQLIDQISNHPNRSKLESQSEIDKDTSPGSCQSCTSGSGLP